MSFLRFPFILSFFLLKQSILRFLFTPAMITNQVLQDIKPFSEFFFSFYIEAVILTKQVINQMFIEFEITKALFIKATIGKPDLPQNLNEHVLDLSLS